jgi:2,4-dienoyl-CoA reductase-like NADH-dependent reductase (Old Yellow Enzyme family)
VSLLFSPLTLRSVTVRNRAWVSPMCQYSSVDGHPTDWHLVHLGSFARGGAGLVFTEATAVSAAGRITTADAGIWNDEQAAAYERITSFVRGQGAVPGVQLAHAGRKASTKRPWDGHGYVPIDAGGWQPVGPTDAAYRGLADPRALDSGEVKGVVRDFAAAARRATVAGFEVIEIHAAHGYLLHEFLSPLTNDRSDGYGGDLAARARLLLEVAEAVRSAVPDATPLLVRLSATDWVDVGLTVDDVATVGGWLRERGVDLLDVSSGGNDPRQQIEPGPGYQVPFARIVRDRSKLPVAAVGMITDPLQAETVLRDGAADAVLLARELLRNPHWPLHAAAALGDDIAWPVQYDRAKRR